MYKSRLLKRDTSLQKRDMQPSKEKAMEKRPSKVKLMSTNTILKPLPTNTPQQKKLTLPQKPNPSSTPHSHSLSPSPIATPSSFYPSHSYSLASHTHPHPSSYYPSHHTFMYYTSQVMRQLNSLKERDENQEGGCNFINHVMYCLYTFKMHRFTVPPLKPHVRVGLDQKVIKTMKTKNVIIFDLDETLVHALREFQDIEGLNTKEKMYKDQAEIQVKNYWKPTQPKENNNQSFEEDKEKDFETEIANKMKSTKTPIPTTSKIKVNIRPYAKQILKRLSKNFTIGIFTAAQQQYTNQTLKLLDPTSTIFSFRLYRQHCHQLCSIPPSSSSCSSPSYESPKYIKDLRVISDINLERVVLVDNSPISYLFQPENGIPIVPFISECQDDQLLKLQAFLHRYLVNSDDVRTVLKKMFRVREYEKCGSVRDVVERVWKFNELLL